MPPRRIIEVPETAHEAHDGRTTDGWRDRVKMGFLRSVVVLGPPAAVWGLVLARITALRKDRLHRRGNFELPYGRSMREIFDPESYTEQGRRLFPWLIVSTGLVLASFVLDAVLSEGL